MRWREGADEWRDLVHDLDARAGAEPTPEQEARMLQRIEALQTATERRDPSALRGAKGLGALGLLGLALLATFAALRPAVKRATPERATPREERSEDVRAPRGADDGIAPHAPEVEERAPREEAPATQPAQRPKRRSVPRARPIDDAPRDGASDPTAELVLLTRARRVLLIDPARSLALIGEHATRYPRGQFAEEREVLAVEALSRAGDHKAARARGESFLRAHPRSAHGVRMRALLADLPQ